MLPPLKWCFCAFGEWMLDFFSKQFFQFRFIITHTLELAIFHMYTVWKPAAFMGFVGMLVDVYSGISEAGQFVIVV